MSDSFTFTKPKWTISKDTKLLETPIFTLRQVDLVPAKQKSPAPFFVLDAPGWINVIALTETHHIILVEQYRAGIHQPALEIPGGMVDENEQPEDAAKRELLEETGYHSGRWTYLGKASANPAIMSNYAHFFVAEQCKKIGEPDFDMHEDIRIHAVPLETFYDLIDTDVVHHSVVLAAVAKYLIKNRNSSGHSPPES